MVINKICITERRKKYGSSNKEMEVSDDLKWDLSRVFKNDQEWEQEYKQVAQEIQELK